MGRDEPLGLCGELLANQVRDFVIVSEHVRAAL